MVTFSEFPNEISLCINISQCVCNCSGCHSSYLAEDIGDNIYYYLEEYFKSKDIKYDEYINDKLLDLLCNSIWEYLNLL